MGTRFRQSLELCGVRNCAIAVVTGNNRSDGGTSVDSSTLNVCLNIEALCHNPEVRILLDLVHVFYL